MKKIFYLGFFISLILSAQIAYGAFASASSSRSTSKSSAFASTSSSSSFASSGETSAFASVESNVNAEENAEYAPVEYQNVDLTYPQASLSVANSSKDEQIAAVDLKINETSEQINENKTALENENVNYKKNLLNIIILSSLLFILLIVFFALLLKRRFSRVNRQW